MRQPNSIHECDIETDLAAETVPHEMQLRYGSADGGEEGEINVEGWEIRRESALEIDYPLARDVVRNEDVTDPGLEEGKYCKYEGSVTIDISMEATS